MKKETKLYNVMFPLWMLLMAPIAWLIVLPADFIIDSIVLLIAMVALKMTDRKQFYKRHILKIWGLGLLADAIGSVITFLFTWIFEIGTMGDELYLTVPALLLSAGLLYLFDYAVTFKDAEKSQRFKLALIYAVATAPYTFLVPSSWLYS